MITKVSTNNDNNISKKEKRNKFKVRNHTHNIMLVKVTVIVMIVVKFYRRLNNQLTYQPKKATTIKVKIHHKKKTNTNSCKQNKYSNQ